MENQNNIAVSSTFPLTISVPSIKGLYGGSTTSVVLYPALMTLVGPNGTGKTQMLRQLFEQAEKTLSSQLNGRKTRYLAAGRGSPFERYRASVDGPGHREFGEAAIGHRGYQEQWNQIESVTGDYLSLDLRPDLRLKVEARLQQLFSRSLRLSWSQNGLAVFMTPMDGGDSYSAGSEASGILQLVALLAAIHNDELAVLAIDEPEISLHPQHQAFILREMMSVVGDPTLDSKKKLILIATHSPSMLPIKSVAEIPRTIFFSHSSRSPTQSIVEAPELKAQKIKALIARLGATHRIAFFANTVLLVEGPSDEIITTQLADRIDHPLLPQNAQIVPVTGKGEFVEVAKLFRMLGKRVVVMADLDALTDSNELVNFFSVADQTKAVASAYGHDSIATFDSQLRTTLSTFISNHWPKIESIASFHPYWSECPATERTEKTKKRVALACLLANEDAYSSTAAPAQECESLRTRFHVLLEMLEKVGCHILRKGTIENYFSTPSGPIGKPEAAAEESASFSELAVEVLAKQYDDVLRALSAAAPLRQVDENELLRERLGAALGAIMQSIKEDSTSDQIAAKAQSIIGLDAQLFSFENISDADTIRIRVSMRSPLFTSNKFPFDIAETDNPTRLIRTLLS